MCAKVNSSLQKIANVHPLIGFVSAEGLVPNPDNLHFSAKALREFGHRYYEEFLKLENKAAPIAEKSTDAAMAKSEMEAL